MIISSGNAKIKLARLLINSKREREKRNLFVLEGVRLAEECISAGFSPQLVLYSQQLSNRGCGILEQFEKTASEVFEVDSELLDRVSDTGTPQGILVIVEKPAVDLPSKIDLILALDKISDPGNLGTILRTSAACGVQVVFLTPNTADVFNPKVVRAGMGAHFKIPIHIMDEQKIKEFCKTRAAAPIEIIISDVTGGVSSWDIDLTHPLCLVIGSEATGVTSELAAISDAKIHIPMKKDIESFNAAVAAGILLYEVQRQREHQ